MASMTYEERLALEQQRDALRRQRDEERMSGITGVRADSMRIGANDAATHGRAGRKWLGGEAGAVSGGGALHGKAGRKWLGEDGGVAEPADGQPRRGHISFFASDGKGNIRRGDNFDDARVMRVYEDQKASYDEMAQIMQGVRQRNAQRQLSLQNDIATLMKLSGGGRVPEELRQFVNRKYGFDGVNTGLLQDSGFAVNGDFVMNIGNGSDANGTSRSVQKITPYQQFMMMNMNDAAFDDADRTALAERLKSAGYSDNEIGRIASLRHGNVADEYKKRKAELENLRIEQAIQKAEMELDDAQQRKEGKVTDAEYRKFIVGRVGELMKETEPEWYDVTMPDGTVGKEQRQRQKYTFQEALKVAQDDHLALTDALRSRNTGGGANGGGGVGEGGGEGEETPPPTQTPEPAPKRTAAPVYMSLMSFFKKYK